MKKVIGITGVAALIAAAAVATEYEVYDARAGCMNNAPSNYTPQQLWNNNYPNPYYVYVLESGDLAKLDEDGGWGSSYCYHYSEPTGREHDYILCRFMNIGSFTAIVARWRADGRDNTNVSKAWFWDGENWDPTPDGVSNEGGTDPAAVTCHVEDYVTGGTLLMLITNWSPSEGDDDFAVTWADLLAEIIVAAVQRGSLYSVILVSH